eukprot:scaffold90010_cov71-Phaeocystis_antarctica.AAC.2
MAANRVYSLADTFLASRQMSVRPGDTWFVPARLWPTEKANSTPHGRGWIAHVQSVQRIAARGDAVTFLCEARRIRECVRAAHDKHGERPSCRAVRQRHGRAATNPNPDLNPDPDPSPIPNPYLP